MGTLRRGTSFSFPRPSPFEPRKETSSDALAIGWKVPAEWVPLALLGAYKQLCEQEALGSRTPDIENGRTGVSVACCEVRGSFHSRPGVDARRT